MTERQKNILTNVFLWTKLACVVIHTEKQLTALSFLKIHDNALNAWDGFTIGDGSWDGFTSMKCISTMYRMSGGGPWFFMLVGVVDWSYYEFHQLYLNVMMGIKHGNQWSRWSNDGMAHALIHLSSLGCIMSQEAVNGGMDLRKKFVTHNCYCTHVLQ